MSAIASIYNITCSTSINVLFTRKQIAFCSLPNTYKGEWQKCTQIDGDVFIRMRVHVRTHTHTTVRAHTHTRYVRTCSTHI